jgi:hypothetical protein
MEPLKDHLPRRGPRAAEPGVPDARGVRALGWESRASGAEGFGPKRDSVAVWSEATEKKETPPLSCTGSSKPPVLLAGASG